jgi:glycosyltransferase involved in cell wall biosynthesis
MAAALRRAGHADLARTASDRWLRHRLRRIGHHDLVYVNAASPPTVQLLDHLPPDPGVVVVAHVHELDIGLRHNLAPEQLGGLLSSADQVIAVSQAVADNLIDGHGVPTDRVHVHHGFIDTAEVPADAGAAVRRRLGISPDAFVLGSLGLPDWRKAPDLFLRVGWLIRRARPDLDLHLLWTGGDPDAPDRWQLDHEAAHLGLGDRTHFVPDVADPGAHLAAMDVFALTSREDAYPLAGLEAAAAGVPIVCFDTGGMPELVQGDAGAVVPYPDVDAFAAAVITLADEPDRRRKEGAIARQRVCDEHDVAVAAPRLWADLRSWLPA